MYEEELKLADTDIASSLSKYLRDVAGAIDTIEEKYEMRQYNDASRALDVAYAETQRGSFEKAPDNSKQIIIPIEARESFEDAEAMTGFSRRSDKVFTKDDGNLYIAIKMQDNTDYDALYQSYIDFLGKTEEANRKTMQNNRDYAVAYTAQINDYYAESTNKLQNHLRNSFTFQGFDKDIQNAILSNFTYDENEEEKFLNEYLGKEKDYIYGEIINPLVSLTEEETQRLLDVMDINFTDTNFVQTLDEYKEQVGGIFTDLFGEESADEMLEHLGFQRIFEEYENMRDYITTSMDGKMSQDETFEIIGMNPADIKLAYELLQQQSYESFQDLIKAMDDARNNISIKNEGTLADIFKDESFSESAKAFTTNLKSITTALDSAKDTLGTVVGDAANTLQEALPNADFGDFGTDTVRKEGVKQLNDYVALLYKQADAELLSAEETEKLNAYITNLIYSYKDMLKLEPQDIFNAIAKSLDGKDSREIDRVVKDFRARFKEQLGNSDDLQILYQLALDPKFISATPEEQFKMFNDLKLKWEVYMDIEDLESSVNKLNELKDKFDDIDKRMNNTKIPKTFKTYDRAIQNSMKQLEQLYIQQNQLLADKKKLDDAKISFDDPDYQNVLTQLRTVDDEIGTVFDNISSWQDAINNLSFDQAQQALDRIQITLEKIQGLMDFKVNLGANMTDSDYTQLELYAQINVNKAKEAWDEAKKLIETDDVNVGFTLDNLDIHSEEYTKRLQDEATAQ